jgi:hypothetical protein
MFPYTYPGQSVQVSIMPMALGQLALFKVSQSTRFGHFKKCQKPAWLLGFGHLDTLKPHEARKREKK